MGFRFYLILPATLRSPKNQNDTTTKDPCCKETFISAECVCSISRECELRGVFRVRLLAYPCPRDCVRTPVDKLIGIGKWRGMRSSKTECMRADVHA